MGKTLQQQNITTTKHYNNKTLQQQNITTTKHYNNKTLIIINTNCFVHQKRKEHPVQIKTKVKFRAMYTVNIVTTNLDLIQKFTYDIL